MDKEMIRRVVRSHLDEVRSCYESALQRHGALAGRVMLQFTIGPEGAIVATNVKSSTIEDPTVGACIAESARSWHFPAPCGSGVVIVSYPFVLEPADAGR